MEIHKNKILMVVIWNMGIGGIQKRLRDIIKEIITNHPNIKIHLLVKTKQPNYFIPNSPKSSKLKIYYFSSKKYRLSSIPFIFWATFHFFKIKPNICLTFLDYLSIILICIKYLFFWRKTKIVLNEGILTSDYLKIHRKNPIWKYLIKLTYQFANTIIVPTIYCKKDLIKNFNIPNKIITIIPNWTLIKIQSPKKNPIYDLIYIGRLEKEKRPLLLIKIIKRLKKKFPNISLCIIGNGSQLPLVKKAIKKLNLSKNIILLNYQKNIVPYLKKSKIFILFSKNEGMPNVILEASICQIPSIINNFKGSNLVIKHKKTGYIFQNTTQMISQVKKLLINRKLRLKLGKQAQIFIKKSSSKHLQKQFIQILLK